MKYIIIGYTSDIDIKTNTARIKYLHCEHIGYYEYDIFWLDELESATTFDYREDAEEIILQYGIEIQYGIENCITYEIDGE